jgi:SPP1 gp7 family putative phage head morphogenesis protein
MASKSSQQEISASINSIINDPARADMIAITETNRAYNAATIDSYQAAGVTTWTWQAYEGACDICLSQEGEHVMGDPYPPAHPLCRCTVPELPTSTGE